jgi:hypothetical protein
MAETYYFGQGQVFSRVRGSGNAGWRWWGDVGDLQISATETEISHTESHSGNRTKVRSIRFSGDTTLTGNLFEIGTANLIEVLRGKLVEIPGGTVTGEELGTVEAGSILIPEFPLGISNLVITDSASAVFDEVHYAVEEPGIIEILDLPSTLPAFPLTASYEYVGGTSVPMFVDTPKDIEVKFVGKNLAENGQRVIVEFYRVATGALQSLTLITDPGASDVTSMPWSASVLSDSSKPADGELGQVGRFITVGV